MEILYANLEGKFNNILSGICLTSIREENSKITKKYEAFDRSMVKDLRDDFLIYIRNYLFLKGYDSVEIANEKSVLTATKDNQDYTFLIDFDHNGNDGTISIKILDKGVKCGISESEAKYVFVISVEKGMMVLLNSEKVKTLAKEKSKGVNIITETESLFKTQYLNLDLDSIEGKAKFFRLK